MRVGYAVFAILCVLSMPAWSRLQNSASSEVILEQVVRWSVQTAGIDPREIHDAMKRARRSAAIPDVHLRYSYGEDDTVRASQDGASALLPSALDSSQVKGDQYRAEFGLRWRLSDLLFHRAEPRLLLQAQRRSSLELEVAARATKTFLAWEAASSELHRTLTLTEEESSVDSASQVDGSAPRHVDELDEAQWINSDPKVIALRHRVRGRRAELDVLTGRRFSAALRSGGWR